MPNLAQDPMSFIYKCFGRCFAKFIPNPKRWNDAEIPPKENEFFCPKLLLTKSPEIAANESSWHNLHTPADF